MPLWPQAIPPYRSLTIKMASDNATTQIYLLTPKQVLGILQISRPTLYRLMGRRLVPFCKVGGSVRFRPIDIEQYIEQNSIKSIAYKI